MFDQHKAYFQKEWVFCFLTSYAAGSTAGCSANYVGGVSVDRISFICFYNPNSAFSIPHSEFFNAMRFALPVLRSPAGRGVGWMLYAIICLERRIYE
ncbi:MAG: hypothetical protein A2026_08925 [Deltaproteobacteria bacterium RBG_19FT_COMBO_46_12]|nr:MAG: hypothetical protein A2026_08925 [Deltaproteobacteria bacterium RBG_19FT_COMBO_46_12]